MINNVLLKNDVKIDNIRANPINTMISSLNLFNSLIGSLIASILAITIVKPMRDSMTCILGIIRLDAAKNKVTLWPIVNPVAASTSCLKGGA
ncbi:MAG: hypothetical protein Ct9H300mP6_13990 [Gammaproteobacteria bacterium]|nr:MAG: hypothetical protein Ct9H300mP6_13990 [Gammaproteobacteria bacterium]